MIKRVILSVFVGAAGACLANSVNADDDRVSELIRQSKHPDFARRQQSVDALGRPGPKAKAAVPRLVEILRDTSEHYNVRGRTCYALGNIGPDAQAAIPVFLQMIHDKADP